MIILLSCRRLPCGGSRRNWIGALGGICRHLARGGSCPWTLLRGKPSRRSAAARNRRFNSNNGQWRKCSAAELLFRWLVEPEKWENIPFLAAQDEQLRQDVLGLPLVDADGRRLRYASPVEVENNAELGRRWAELQRREEAEGKDFRLTGVEKSIKNLVDAYGKYRQLTFNLKSPKVASQRFYGRVRSAGDALGKLAGDLLAAQRISRDKDIRQATVEAGNALQKLIAQIHGDEFALEKVEPLVAAFCRAGDQLAARLTDTDDKPPAALAADLRRQAAEMHSGALRQWRRLAAGSRARRRQHWKRTARPATTPRPGSASRR